MLKTNLKIRFYTFILLFTLFLSQIPVTVSAASARPTDIDTADSGNILVGISGTYEYVSKTKILKRINEIRKEACTKGYINPSTGEKLKASDYVPIKWSSDLEWIAQIRAAEATVYQDHTRPNGKSCFSICCNGQQSWAESLAWNYTGLMHGIEQWYSEKKDWIKQNNNAVTGHYTSMINPNYTYIGLGSFGRESGGWKCTAAEFGYGNTGSEAKSKLKGKTIQIIEVTQKSIKKPKLSAPSSINVKKKNTLSVTCNIVYPGIMGGKNTSKGSIEQDIIWKSSKPSVLFVNAKGKIKAKKSGKATITAEVSGLYSLKKKITVKK